MDQSPSSRKSQFDPSEVEYYFDSHPEARRRLLLTGNRIITDGSEENSFGKLLMDIRGRGGQVGLEQPLAGDKLKIENNPLGKFSPGALKESVDTSRLSEKQGIDPSRLSEDDLKTWKRMVEIANAKDVNGRYLNPTLHEVYAKLNNGNRTFFIYNTDFGRNSPTVGKFTITEFKGENDFSEAVIELDFKKIKGIDRPTDADRVAGFKKFEGLLGGGKMADLRLAEVFGHEGSHAQKAINNPAENVKLQKLLNERDEMLAGPTYRDKKGRLLNPMPQALKQKMEEV